jgi:hypothetical protein
MESGSENIYAPCYAQCKRSAIALVLALCGALLVFPLLFLSSHRHA